MKKQYNNSPGSFGALPIGMYTSKSKLFGRLFNFFFLGLSGIILLIKEKMSE